jgi:hypothetical protein
MRYPFLESYERTFISDPTAPSRAFRLLHDIRETFSLRGEEIQPCGVDYGTRT